MSVGLDIGSQTIKAIELSREGNKFKLKAAGVVGYKGVSPEHLEDPKAFATLAGAIKKLIKDTKVSSKEVVTALPEAQVFTRVIKFPLLTDQEVAAAVKWEAEQYIPIPVTEAIIQHQILERNEEATPGYVMILLVAAPRKLVEKYVKVITSASLNCVAVETEFLSLARALAPTNQTSLIIDLGARSTDLAIAKNGNLVFSRSIPTAGDALTRAVAQSLGVSPSQAEEYKRTYGLTPGQLEGKVGGALQPILGVISEEIKKAIQYYQSEEKGQPPTSLILSGGGSGIPEIAPFLTKKLGLEVVLGNPFARVVIDPAAAKNLASYAPIYSIAVGLAMRPT
jgi:type IV pilus assembly protein PilM